MEEPTPHQIKAALLEILPEPPETMPRPKARAWLCRYLGTNVDEDRFSAIVDQLIGERLVLVGAGRGGTLAAVTNPVPTTIVENESALYEPVENLIRLTLRELISPASTNYIVEITARQGRTSGRFRHPDLVMVSRTEHKLLGRSRTDVFSFEVKTETGGDAVAVLEAMSQRERSHFAYVVWELQDKERRQDRYEQVVDYANKHGIGLILLRKIDKIGKRLAVAEHEIIRYADRHNADPLQIEKLLENHLSSNGRTELLSWYGYGTKSNG